MKISERTYLAFLVQNLGGETTDRESGWRWCKSDKCGMVVVVVKVSHWVDVGSEPEKVVALCQLRLSWRKKRTEFTPQVWRERRKSQCVRCFIIGAGGKGDYMYIYTHTLYISIYTHVYIYNKICLNLYEYMYVYIFQVKVEHWILCTQCESSSP